MDPEQRLPVILKYLAVKFFIFILCTLIGMLVPKRIDIAERHRAFQDLSLLHRLFLLTLFAVFSLFYFFLRLLYDLFDHRVLFCHLFAGNRLILRLSICLGEENLHRHKGAVFLQNLPHTVFIGKLIAVLVEVKDDLCTYGILLAWSHFESQAAV